MGKTIDEIAEQLNASNKKVQLIYAFNGTGKTRLSQAFKNLVQLQNSANDDDVSLTRDKILYYNAFTEDLFYWDNDLASNQDYKMKIQPNTFINWAIKEQGLDQNIISKFQHYTDDKLTPIFDLDNGQITFSFQRGNQENPKQVKLSKGEESNFIWSIFHALLELVISELSIAESENRSTNEFDDLAYVFIDDPVSSLDENHLIEFASNIGMLIKTSKSSMKFIITTHNPLFYNVLHNELSGKCKYRLEKLEDGSFNLEDQKNDAPFAYHHFLITEIQQAIESNNIQRYHFNLFRNLLEKTTTFLGYKKWGDLLPNEDGAQEAYEKRMINILSHSAQSADEAPVLNIQEQQLLKFMFNKFLADYKFNKE